MKILAIPGKMPATKAWLEKIIAQTPWKHEEITLHNFSAWGSDDEFSVTTEVQSLPFGHFDVVITKSIGTLITLKAQRKISWDKLVFIGVAWSLYSEQDKALLPALDNQGKPVLIIQENHDPFGSFQEINQVVSGKKCIKCVEVSGERHQYADVEQIGSIISNWLESL
ncbi:hypothetical protein [Photobacterium damselae]|uniref:hypothetical protein n=1 Tax=Photobacterium damselae TaxID=38293 RepID=UPI001EDD8ABB|nr:hypothetical protein [Photobacterium damselae]MCG3825681.1 hypothetical protein [Photobacterium damselae]